MKNNNRDTEKKVKTNYSSLWFTLGTCLGCSLGIIFDNLAICIGLGMSIGVATDFYNKRH